MPGRRRPPMIQIPPNNREVDEILETFRIQGIGFRHVFFGSVGGRPPTTKKEIKWRKEGDSAVNPIDLSDEGESKAFSDLRPPGFPESSSSSTPEDCSICLEEIKCDATRGVLVICSHVYHKDCVQKYVDEISKENPRRIPKCPLCRSSIELVPDPQPARKRPRPRPQADDDLSPFDADAVIDSAIAWIDNFRAGLGFPPF